MSTILLDTFHVLLTVSWSGNGCWSLLMSSFFGMNRFIGWFPKSFMVMKTCFFHVFLDCFQASNDAWQEANKKSPEESKLTQIFFCWHTSLWYATQKNKTNIHTYWVVPPLSNSGIGIPGWRTKTIIILVVSVTWQGDNPTHTHHKTHTQSEAFDSVSSRGHLDFYHHHLDLMATAMACFSDFWKRWGEGRGDFRWWNFCSSWPDGLMTILQAESLRKRIRKKHG